MINADCHVHTSFSTDSNSPMEQMLQKAIQLGLKTICFTDHMDFDYPSKIDTEFLFNMNDYQKQIVTLKEKYHNKIQLLMGIELGLQPHLNERLSSFVRTYPFDFIIGSSHVVQNLDPYYPSYWDNRTVFDGIFAYYQTIIDNCKAFQGFHSYGHLDYIIRYVPSNKTESASFSYKDYSDLIDTALRTIIYYGKALEINTAGYKYGLGHPNPHPDIIRRYKELGGELITIGSDAHSPEHIGSYFSQVEALLTTIGFRYYATYIGGSPIFETIS